MKIALESILHKGVVQVAFKKYLDHKIIIKLKSTGTPSYDL